MLRRPLAPDCVSSPLAPRNRAEMSICSPELSRASLSKVRDILSFSIFDKVEVGSPVRRLTSASVQPFLRRNAFTAAPGLATDVAGPVPTDVASSRSFRRLSLREAARFSSLMNFDPQAILTLGALAFVIMPEIYCQFGHFFVILDERGRPDRREGNNHAQASFVVESRGLRVRRRRRAAGACRRFLDRSDFGSRAAGSRGHSAEARREAV